MRPHVIGAAFMAHTTTVGAAQWHSYPTPGLPRGADGKPNFTAPTPRTADARPDLSGVWTGPGNVLKPAPGDVQPWAIEAARRHTQNFYKDRPMFRCLPSGSSTNSASIPAISGRLRPRASDDSRRFLRARYSPSAVPSLSDYRMTSGIRAVFVLFALSSIDLPAFFGPVITGK